MGAEQTVLRMALAMMACYPESACTATQRHSIVARLQSQAPLTDAEQAWLKEPLLAFIKEHHARIFDIVSAQFAEEMYEQ